MFLCVVYVILVWSCFRVIKSEKVVCGGEMWFEGFGLEL